MAYEYEKENIRKLNSYNVLSGGANITKSITELQEVYRKAKAFDTFLKYKKHVEKYGKQGGNELDKVFESVMEEYEE